MVKNFLRGLFVFLPFLLCWYFIFWVVSTLENLFKGLLLVFLPVEWYFPGLGVITGVFSMGLLGLLVASPFAHILQDLMEYPFKRTPVLRTLYSGISNIIKYLSGGEKKNYRKVVLIRPTHSPLRLVGLLTQDQADKLPAGMAQEKVVAVFVPMSFQIGGLTVFVPPEWLVETDLDFESALRGALTGWIVEGESEEKKMQGSIKEASRKN